MNNQRIAAFDRNNAKNFISNYLPGYIVKDKKYFSNKPNIYALFIEFVKSGDFNLEITKTEIRQYFQLLKEKMLSGSTNTKPQNRKLLRKKTDTLELFPTDES